MRSLEEKAHLLNELLTMREDIARTLLTTADRLSLANVHALKAKHASVCRRLGRLQRDLEPHAAGLARTIPELPVRLMRVRRDLR